jgi:plasmid stabilization system protein ParE
MTPRTFRYSADAITDLTDVWALVYRNDGEARADGVLARVEAFCRSLEEFPEVGTRHDKRLRGLRSTGIPGLNTVTILFIVTKEQVTVLRIGYLGRNVWADIPALAGKT